MKFVIICLVTLLFTTVFASDVDMLVYMLSSESVKTELQGKDIETVHFKKGNVSTAWTFTASIKTVEDGLGPNGPDTHPCFTVVEVVSIGGVAGTETSEPKASTVCAMNSPIPSGN